MVSLSYDVDVFRVMGMFDRLNAALLSSAAGCRDAVMPTNGKNLDIVATHAMFADGIHVEVQYADLGFAEVTLANVLLSGCRFAQCVLASCQPSYVADTLLPLSYVTMKRRIRSGGKATAKRFVLSSRGRSAFQYWSNTR